MRINDEIKEPQVVVYGSTWSPYAQCALGWLEAWQVPYRYVDVDNNPGARTRIAEWNNGEAIHPTIAVQGKVLVNPDAVTLMDELDWHGLLPAVKNTSSNSARIH